jgi:hypothetical protein
MHYMPPRLVAPKLSLPRLLANFAGAREKEQVLEDAAGIVPMNATTSSSCEGSIVRQKTRRIRKKTTKLMEASARSTASGDIGAMLDCDESGWPTIGGGLSALRSHRISSQQRLREKRRTTRARIFRIAISRKYWLLMVMMKRVSSCADVKCILGSGGHGWPVEGVPPVALEV